VTVARSLSDIRHRPNSVVTVGTFDGMHMGHRAIIKEVTGRAERAEGRSVVVTFDPHPRLVVGRGPVKLLSSLTERLDILERLGVELTLVVEFTYEFSRKTSREFYEEYVVRGIGVKEVIIGHDHMFGRDREAGVDELREMGKTLGFTSFALDPVTVGGEAVSSSKIREYLLQGNVERAAQFLSMPYALCGNVVRGAGRGASLGFPTANVLPEPESKLVPAPGVYCVRIECDGRTHSGMLNIGTRPTFTSSSEHIVEVHVFDFSDNIYGKSLRISFLSRLRSERTFSSASELVAQLEADRRECQRILTPLHLS
jgi:riboflavin kinase / FMN adenylyltransferase